LGIGRRAVMYLFFQLQILKFAFKIHLMMIYKLEGGESRVGRGVLKLKRPASA